LWKANSKLKVKQRQLKSSTSTKELSLSDKRPMEENPFRVFLLQISENLRKDEWKNCASRFDIPIAKREKFTTAFEFLWWLYEEQTKLQYLDLLKDIFNKSGRLDLVEFIEKFEGK
jgi:hypothetical protein